MGDESHGKVPVEVRALGAMHRHLEKHLSTMGLKIMPGQLQKAILLRKTSFSGVFLCFYVSSERRANTLKRQLSKSFTVVIRPLS